MSESKTEISVTEQNTESKQQNTEEKKLSKKERKALEFREKLESKKLSKQQKQEDPEKRIKEKEEKKEERKESKKLKRKAIDEAEASKNENTKHPEPSADSTPATTGSKKKKRRKSKTKKEGESANRFLLFVGNLPFNYEQSELEAHFTKAKPDVIRGRLKSGFAFLEFKGDDASQRLVTALKFHHSEFKGRKINVELTAGGGGNSDLRREKIREKNEKLEQQRKAEIEKENELKAQRKHIKFDDKKEGESVDAKPKDTEESNTSVPEEEDVSGIHPSRRRLITDESKKKKASKWKGQKSVENFNSNSSNRNF